MEAIARAAAEDAALLEEHGWTAVMIENFHDAPFTRRSVAPETVAALGVVGAAVRRAVSIPLGINVLRNDGLAALGVAAACDADLIRVNVLAGAAVTDQGLVQGEAADLLRHRAHLGLDDRVAILADVDVKHATSLDDRPLGVRAADLVSRSGADGVLVTGDATGLPADREHLAEVVDAVAPAPTLVASGATPESLPGLLESCAGAIVGTAVKDPRTGRVDPQRARACGEVLR